MHGNGLHVLTADIQDERDVGAEALGCVCVGDGFHSVVVCVDGLCKELFAVTGCTHAQDVELHAVFFVAVGEVHHGALQDGERFTVVAGVEAVDDLFVFVDEHELRGGRTCVNAQVGVDGRAGRRLRVMVPWPCSRPGGFR